MYKRVIVSILFLLLIAQTPSSAYIIDDEFGLEQSLFMRWAAQKQLKLNSEQKILQENINNKYSPMFSEKFFEIGNTINELRELANSNDCTKDKVDKIVEDFKVKEKELCELNKIYEKEINHLLKPTQRLKYSFLLFCTRVRLQRELKNEIKNFKKSCNQL